ncbi:MAG: penicillin acylase family protein [Flaviflexus sp.]|uniref:penicillin acylase family protein n=1 Tax=Flaviflexus sp. TaxID=1969482 RepID=UPI00352DA098
MLAGGGFLVKQLNKPLPYHGGEHVIEGADGTIEIIRDEYGIPNIYATTDADLFRAQGYIHAQDRFFEMDYRRHMTGGRLSELVGDVEAAKQADTVIRSMGWRKLAEEEWDMISQESRDFYDAYADGVNAYIADRSPGELGLEYTVLSLSVPVADIEPWTGIDSLAWLKAMAWDLKNNIDDETGRVVAYASLGDSARVEELYPAFSTTGHEPILPSVNGTNLEDRDSYPRTGGIPMTNGEGGDGRGLEPAGTGPDSDDDADSSDSNGSNANGASESETDASGAATRKASTGNAAGLQDSEIAITEAVTGAHEALETLPIMLGRGSAVGSNSFIIGGEHTESGMPILSNDPHLTISYPSVWYQVGLHCVKITDNCTYDATGFSFSGMPGLIIGRNSELAWGLTNLGGDVTDLVIEKNTGETTYERDGEDVEYEIRTETINVAGGDSFDIEVRESIHGPIVSDLLIDDTKAADLPDAPGDFSVALEWTALKPGTTGDAIFAINRASNADEVREAAAIFEVPAQNIVFTTADGHFGYQAPGRFPIRPTVTDADGDLLTPQEGNLGADGRWPRPGWDSAYDWQGYYDVEDMPSALDPDEGFIVAANQQVTPSELGPYLGSYSDAGYRSQAIRDEIEADIDSGTLFTVERAEKIMMLDQSPYALELGQQFADVSSDNERVQEAQGILSAWLEDGGHNAINESGAAIMASAYAHLIDNTLAKQIEGFYPSNSSNYLVFFAGLEEDSQWWDNPETEAVETRDDAMNAALVAMDADLSEQMGEDMSEWTWGQIHVETPTHPVMGGDTIPSIVRNYFNGDPLPIPGGPSIPNANGFSPAVDEDGLVDYEVTAGPSMRIVVDMSDLDAATWIISSGSSGHPRSGHVDDQFEMWSKGESLDWAFTREAVDQTARDTMIITGG